MTARVRLEDLPPRVRRRVTGETRPRRARASRTDQPSLARSCPTSKVTCADCGASFVTYRSAERHLDAAHGSGRLALFGP